MPALDGPSSTALDKPLTVGSVALAWTPFALMSLLLLAAGIMRQKETAWIAAIQRDPANHRIPALAGVQSVYLLEVPGLHLSSARDADLREDRAIKPEEAVYKFEYLTSAGTPVFIAALLSIALLRMTPRQGLHAFAVTCRQMKVPVPTIALMIGLSYVTRYGGLDATLGFAFSRTAALYPFFAAFLGWLGVFLTGTDAGSNALFGSLQKIVADRIHTFTNLSQTQTQVLICTTNSTGGVMGKMIDAQSICVATAATHQLGKEADIFKAVVWHSLALAALVGLLTLAQAYLWPFTAMVPELPR
jgi:lactate permease